MSNTSNAARLAVAAMTLSAAAFIGLLASEGYTERAVIPTQGDVPTVGFGSTRNADGSAVKMGQRTDPVNALHVAHAHISRDEAAFRASLPDAFLTQAEYDVYLDFVYQYGMGNWRTSDMRRHVLAGQYRAACDALLRYRFAAGFDCSTPGNKRCPGVWTRQRERHRQCVAEAADADDAPQAHDATTK